MASLSSELAENKGARTETGGLMSSLREPLSKQAEELERAMSAQLEGHKQEIREEVGGINTKLSCLEERVSKLEEVSKEPLVVFRGRLESLEK